MVEEGHRRHAYAPAKPSSGSDAAMEVGEGVNGESRVDGEMTVKGSGEVLDIDTELLRTRRC